PRRRSPVTPGRLFDRARRARAGLPATGDQRRRGRADRRRRAHHGRGVAATLPDPSRQKRLGQGAEKRSGRGEGRLLGDLRPARGCPARPGRGGQGSSQDRLVRHTLARLVSGGGALPARRPRLADRLPAVSARALDPRAPLQLHRTHLRRDAPPGQGDRPAARRALLPVAAVGGTRPRLGRVARVRHDLRRTPITAGPAPQHARPANPTAATEFGTTHRNRPGTNRFHSHRVASPMQASGTDIRHFYTAPGTPPGAAIRRTDELRYPALLWLLSCGYVRLRADGEVSSPAAVSRHFLRNGRYVLGHPSFAWISSGTLTSFVKVLVNT